LWFGGSFGSFGDFDHLLFVVEFASFLSAKRGFKEIPT
jgi:hypothetical protein